MAYKLIVTEHADELLDNLVYHLLYRLKNHQATKHLLDEIENIYSRLEMIVPQMNYTVIFSINADIVNVAGIFHQLENYQTKL